MVKFTRIRTFLIVSSTPLYKLDFLLSQFKRLTIGDRTTELRQVAKLLAEFSPSREKKPSPNLNLPDKLFIVNHSLNSHNKWFPTLGSID